MQETAVYCKEVKTFTMVSIGTKLCVSAEEEHELRHMFWLLAHPCHGNVQLSFVLQSEGLFNPGFCGRLSSCPRAGLKPGKWEHGHSRRLEWKETLRGVKPGPNATQMPFSQLLQDVAQSSECTPFSMCPQGGWVLPGKLNGSWGKPLDP